jgi:hypothetical protein
VPSVWSRGADRWIYLVGRWLGALVFVWGFSPHRHRVRGVLAESLHVRHHAK